MANVRIPTDDKIEAVRRRSEDERVMRIRARAVSVNDEGYRSLTLENGTCLVLHRSCIDELADASQEQLAKVALWPGGDTIECDPLDVHISVEGFVLEAIMGTMWAEKVCRLSASLMGKVRSDAKAARARENGQKGGMPPKALKASMNRGGKQSEIGLACESGSGDFSLLR